MEYTGKYEVMTEAITPVGRQIKTQVSTHVSAQIGTNKFTQVRLVSTQVITHVRRNYQVTLNTVEHLNCECYFLSR